MDQHLITRIVEAALLAGNQPLSLAQLQALFPEDQPPPSGAVAQAIQTLQDACAERGVELVELASGFRYQVKVDVHPWVARLWTERKTKYTRATLETLALIAYRQPITRGEIEQIRGVAVSSNIIQALEEREWIRVVGHRDVPGRPALFGTTRGFLDYFGLKRLDELPPLSEIKDIGELEPQLALGDAPLPAGGIGNADDAPNDEDGGDNNTGVPIDDVAASANQENTAPMGTPEAAPGERAADENDHEQDNAVATTTVPEVEAASHEDAPEQENHD
ncbi:SMC-Scp complex subunit ScpB [Aerolutibacter ruishenii]|uniref:Condensin subunit ScpB n=1 Tax=Aerolutibacter ruishenii TaxID=686800 RepID=A0A562LYB4_9GAMM|nr:SMC-Scp complex subunit ScpB [Lysobacter ruishenii]TWI12634.1 condensin subunit ScpB [Lysobacter ruishenii]